MFLPHNQISIHSVCLSKPALNLFLMSGKDRLNDIIAKDAKTRVHFFNELLKLSNCFGHLIHGRPDVGCSLQILVSQRHYKKSPQL